MNKPDPIHSEDIREQLEDYFYQALEVELLLRLFPDDEDTICQIVDLLVDTCATKRRIRKMALDGYCLHLDLKELRRMAYLLQMCSNNLNQYAKAANENGRVYAADMEDLRQRLDELIEIGRQILSRLADL